MMDAVDMYHARKKAAIERRKKAKEELRQKFEPSAAAKMTTFISAAEICGCKGKFGDFRELQALMRGPERKKA